MPSIERGSPDIEQREQEREEELLQAEFFTSGNADLSTATWLRSKQLQESGKYEERANLKDLEARGLSSSPMSRISSKSS